MDEDEDFDLSDEEIAELDKLADPAPLDVQVEFNQQLDQYEADLRNALKEKFGV